MRRARRASKGELRLALASASGSPRLTRNVRPIDSRHAMRQATESAVRVRLFARARELAGGDALSLSLSTGLLAIAMLVAGSLSEVWGRKPVMVVSLLSSAALTIASAAAPDWATLLVVRALIGLTLSGLPAVAMAYVSEEVHPRSIGLAMGLLIGGNAIGGMAGRLLSGILTDLGSWRLAVGTIGKGSILATAATA